MTLLGCIADDFTGATDLCSMLVRNGMRTVQLIGVPSSGDPVPDADAIVVALKSRTIPAAEAVEQSLAALAWLQRAGCRQFFFKYCSTFDSTPAGNIGPVADALVARLDCGFAIACPAFPANARTVFQGHLFVGSTLLSESGMQDHPLTPMQDANLVRVLSRQTEGTVGLVPFATVAAGPGAIRDALTRLREQGRRYAIVDAVADEHLLSIGAAVAQHTLVTGGSGVAMGLPENFRQRGLLSAESADDLPAVTGSAAVLAGSCSRATLLQISTSRDLLPTLELDPLETPDSGELTRQAIGWAETRLGNAPIVIAASATPDRVAALQAKLGREAAGSLVETAMSQIARTLVERGVRRLVVAGGETSGAVVSALGIKRLRIGAEIAPGVPWTYAEGGAAPLLVALKSGNFGGPQFFQTAFELH
ncbi:MAG: four-carbon acid sugar kinase family protein [Acetobacteraceae bacterium]|nr:four-carbon acid sugar kinase family protein [Acetobacteraceae bacterium]